MHQRPIKQRWKVILYPGLIAALLCCASPAAADGIGGAGGQNISGLDDGVGDLPPADLAGWFQTFDPSNEWTNAANIATMEAWLVLAEGLGADPASLTQLSGAISNLALEGGSSAAAVPEPATLELLGVALAMLGLYARRRRLAYVSICGNDRSRGDRLHPQKQR